MLGLLFRNVSVDDVLLFPGNSRQLQAHTKELQFKIKANRFLILTKRYFYYLQYDAYTTCNTLFTLPTIQCFTLITLQKKLTGYVTRN